MAFFYCLIFATIPVGLCEESLSWMSSSSYYDSDLVANESVAIKLLDKFNAGIGDYQANFIGSQFAYYTDSTEENRGKIDMARLELAIFSQKKLRLSSFEVENFSSDTKRRIEALLKPGIGGSSTGGSLLRRYSQATACLSSDNCFTLDPDLSRIMAKSRDYDQLYWAWNSWRDVAGRPSRDDFILEVESNNHNSISYGFTDTSDHWRSAYEVDDIAEQVNKLYADLAPLYTQLHAYVRRKLYNYYGPDYINLEGPIPAHLLGNMWAQSWINIFDIVQPYPVNSTVDLTAAIRKKYFNGEELFRAAEDFFLSLGMLKASKSFWEESLFERPQDGRKVVCHGTAWDFQNQEDLRISMCADLTLVDFIIAHHEMGHIQYYMQYVDQPFEFRQGANPGFHEAVGDVIALSASTPEYHRNIGLIDEIEDNEEADINFLMRQALDKIAFLPFSFLVDTWRWGVFNGSIPPEKYNTKWWEFREKFQGVQPPTPRTEEHFDPAAKYHISAGTPYLRYFVSTVTQFQFHQALCDAAGHVGPLFKCNLHNSTEAGKLFSEMLQFGSSQHWTNAMETITGQTEMKSDALVEYFKPLTEWLEKQNENETIGWDRAHRWYPQAPDPWYGGASVMQHSAYLLMTCVLLNSLFT
ncbi:angiotensin-converting enzyme-like [Apostichopus japonicus]|uniref:angiotensin-converting enzyme-like n=1 Tax=Stichopus japonicus TaxID=307972 RepID=UPI003AB6DC95